MSASVAVTLIVCVVFVHGRNLQDPASIADDDSNGSYIIHLFILFWSVLVHVIEFC